MTFDEWYSGAELRFVDLKPFVREVWDEVVAVCVRIAEAEAEAYRANGKRCDAAGNLVSGTHDAAASLGCARVAGELRLLLTSAEPTHD